MKKALTIFFALFVLNCYSQKDSVVNGSNLVRPKSITDILMHPEIAPYFRIGDAIIVSGDTYTIKRYIPISTPPPIITYDTFDVIMLVTDTAYDTPRFSDNMGMDFDINRKDVYAMDGYIVTKKIDKGTFPYTTENVGYLDLDKIPVKNKIIWMSVRKPKNKNNEKTEIQNYIPMRFDYKWQLAESPNR